MDTNLKQFDSATLKMLRNDLDSALKVVADKYGIGVKAGNATYSPENATFKVELAVKNEGGMAVTKEATEYKRMANFMGLKAEWLNQEFLFRGEKYLVVGLKPKSYKFPVLAKRYDGKVFKIPVNAVRKGFGLPYDPAYSADSNRF